MCNIRQFSNIYTSDFTTRTCSKHTNNNLMVKETEILHEILHHSKFSSCYKTFIGVLKVVIDNIYFGQQYDFPLNIFIMCLILILKNTHCRWNEIDEYPEYKFYENIWDLSIRSFCYHNNETKRSPCVILCSLSPIKDSSCYLRATLYLLAYHRG